MHRKNTRLVAQISALREQVNALQKKLFSEKRRTRAEAKKKEESLEALRVAEASKDKVLAEVEALRTQVQNLQDSNLPPSVFKEKESMESLSCENDYSISDNPKALDKTASECGSETRTPENFRKTYSREVLFRMRYPSALSTTEDYVDALQQNGILKSGSQGNLGQVFCLADHVTDGPREKGHRATRGALRPQKTVHFASSKQYHQDLGEKETNFVKPQSMEAGTISRTPRERKEEDSFHEELSLPKPTEKAWLPGRVSLEKGNECSRLKRVRSLLNKLTPEKFERILEQFLEIRIDNLEVLEKVSGEVFEKALFEPKFAWIYADLCDAIERRSEEMFQITDLDKTQEQASFRRMILSHSHRQFIADYPPEGAANKDYEDLAKEAKARKRKLSNIYFIAQLFSKGLADDSVIQNSIVQSLLNLTSNKNEGAIEALCTFLQQAGSRMGENQDGAVLRAHCVDSLAHFSQALTPRIRFMVNDLTEQSKNEWKRRGKEVKAKTIAEVHREVEEEWRAKEVPRALRRRVERHSSEVTRNWRS